MRVEIIAGEHELLRPSSTRCKQIIREQGVGNPQSFHATNKRTLFPKQETNVDPKPFKEALLSILDRAYSRIEERFDLSLQLNAQTRLSGNLINPSRLCPTGRGAEHKKHKTEHKGHKNRFANSILCFLCSSLCFLCSVPFPLGKANPSLRAGPRRPANTTRLIGRNRPMRILR